MKLLNIILICGSFLFAFASSVKLTSNVKTNAVSQLADSILVKLNNNRIVDLNTNPGVANQYYLYGSVRRDCVYRIIETPIIWNKSACRKIKLPIARLTQYQSNIEDVQKRETFDIKDLFITDSISEYILCYWTQESNIE